MTGGRGRDQHASDVKAQGAASRFGAWTNIRGNAVVIPDIIRQPSDLQSSKYGQHYRKHSVLLAVPSTTGTDTTTLAVYVINCLSSQLLNDSNDRYGSADQLNGTYNQTPIDVLL